MVIPSQDLNGNVYPPYGVLNDEGYKKTQPKDAEKIIQIIKANGPLNSKISSNCYSRLNSGRVKFLISQQQAKIKLLETKAGQKMSPEKRIERLMPHEMTTVLIEEMCNLKMKPTGTNNDVVLELINKSRTKDKWSSMSYGLWRIRELEEEYYKKEKRSKIGKRNLLFFN